MRFNRFSNNIKFDIFAAISAEDLCTTVAPVCREWRQFSYTPGLWTDVELSTDTQSIYQMVQVLNRCTGLRRLTISDVKDFSWILKCPVITSLRVLYLFNCNISPETASLLTTMYPNVEIFVARFSIYADDILAKDIIRWSYLKFIYLNSENGESNKCLDLITNNCHNLCKLHAANFRDIRDRTFVNFIKQRGRHLQNLRIGGLNNLSSNAYKLLPKCHHLTELELFGSKNLTDQDFYNLRELTELDTLKIEDNDKLFSSAFADLFFGVNFPSIQAVTLLQCINLNKSCLKTFIKSCGPNLRFLEVSVTNNLTVTDCKIVAQKFGFDSYDFAADDRITCVLQRMDRR